MIADLVDVQNCRLSRRQKRNRCQYMKEYRSGEEGRIQRQAWHDEHLNYYPDWRVKNREKYNKQQLQWRLENKKKWNEYMRNLMRKCRSSRKERQRFSGK